jgi:starvation-inducible DNA-binding protein
LEFKIYTNALKAYENEGGERFVAGTTSSTIRDLHGDEMSLNALKSMADTARQNMTVFLNHNYNVPEDLFGSATDAQIVKRFDSETGQEVYDLDLNIRVVNEDENPEALRAYRAIKRGVKLGLSIGARVEKASRKAAGDGQPESIVIEKVRLMEASVVGIPANQRSYLHNAIKSIKSSGLDLDLLDEEELEEKAAPGALSTGDFVTWGSSGGAARGRITRIVKDGKVNVPNSDFTVQGTPEDPAALIRVYRKNSEGWAATETIVGHKFSTLRKIQPLKAGVDLIDLAKAVEVEGQASPDKAPLIGSLYNLLAEATAFYLKAHGAHWNVVGDDFATYHDLFGEIYEDVHGSLDPIAESLRKLNSPAPAELKDLARMTVSSEMAEGYEAESLAKALYAANESLLEVIMVAFKAANDLNQQGIANFLAERQDMHQKWSWQLRSSLAEEEDEATDEVSGEQSDEDSDEQEKNMDTDLEKKTRVTVTVSTDGDEKQPAAPVATAESADQTDLESKDEVKASASPEDTEPAVEVEEEAEAEESEKDPAIEALEALGATLVEAEKSADSENESSAQPEVAEAEVVAEAPVEEAPAAENVEADAISSIDEVKSIAKSALDAANAAHEEVAAISAKVTELAEAKAKVEEDLSKALELIERISALGVGRKSYDRPQEVRVKSPELAPWLSPYVQRVLEAQDEE